MKIKLGVLAILAVLLLGLMFSEKTDPAFEALWLIKRSEEKVYTKFKTGQDRIDYNYVMLNRRLKELESLVAGKNYNFILSASLRYSTTAGQLTEMVTDTHKLAMIFMEQRKVLQELLDKYPKDVNEEWKYIQDDINYLDIYLDKLVSGDK